jgi:hypothetical protein
MSTSWLVATLAGTATLLLILAATQALPRPRTSRPMTALSFVCATWAGMLGLTPLIAIPLLTGSAAGFVVTLGSEPVRAHRSCQPSSGERRQGA